MKKSYKSHGGLCVTLNTSSTLKNKGDRLSRSQRRVRGTAIMSTTSKQHNAHCKRCISLLIRPPNVSREGLKFYPWPFYFSFFMNSPCCSSHAEDDHQMYFGGLFVGKASTIGIAISPTPPLIFTGVKKCEICRRLKHLSTLSHQRFNMQQLKISEFWNESAMLRRSPYVLAKFGKVGSTQPWESSVSSAPPPKIARENSLNRG